MIFNKSIIIGIYVVIGVYMIYKLFFNKIKPQNDYERCYNEILTSDKHKVKGQYDK